jgi:hypothetical protein
MPRCIRCDQPGLRFILNYCSQRSSRERIENGTERSNARNRLALRRPKPASNERPVSLATSSHARGAALGNKSSTQAAGRRRLRTIRRDGLADVCRTPALKIRSGHNSCVAGRQSIGRTSAP